MYFPLCWTASISTCSLCVLGAVCQGSEADRGSDQPSRLLHPYTQPMRCLSSPQSAGRGKSWKWEVLEVGQPHPCSTMEAGGLAWAQCHTRLIVFSLFFCRMLNCALKGHWLALRCLRGFRNSITLC